MNLRSGVQPRSVMELEAPMIDGFGYVCRHTENLQKILTIRQGKRSVCKYAHDFENAYRKLSTYDDSWAQQIFVWGLGRDLAI